MPSAAAAPIQVQTDGTGTLLSPTKLVAGRDPLVVVDSVSGAQVEIPLSPDRNGPYYYVGKAKRCTDDTFSITYSDVEGNTQFRLMDTLGRTLASDVLLGDVLSDDREHLVLQAGDKIQRRLRCVPSP